MKLEHSSASEREAAERRAKWRKVTQIRTQTFEDPQAPVTAWIVDLSQCGCRMEVCNGSFAKGQVLTLVVMDNLLVDGVVRWARENTVGVEFLSEIPHDLVAAA